MKDLCDIDLYKLPDIFVHHGQKVFQSSICRKISCSKYLPWKSGLGVFYDTLIIVQISLWVQSFQCTLVCGNSLTPHSNIFNEGILVWLKMRCFGSIINDDLIVGSLICPASDWCLLDLSDTKSLCHLWILTQNILIIINSFSSSVLCHVAARSTWVTQPLFSLLPLIFLRLWYAHSSEKNSKSAMTRKM